jgi:HlyD family secretion protein
MKRLVVVVVVAVAGLAVTFADGGSAPRYRLAAVTRGDVTQTVSVTGSVDHVNRADVSFGTDGTVASLTVAPGSEVRAGQSLGALDTAAAQAVVDEAAATLTSAEAALSAAEAAAASAPAAGPTAEEALSAAAAAMAAQREVCRELTSPACAAAMAATMAAQEAVEEAVEEAGASAPGPEQSVPEARAAVEEASAALVAAQQALDGTALTSPIAGTVASVTATLGGHASAGAPVVVVVGAGAATVTATVPVARVDSLAVGQEATVTAVGTSTGVTGTVTAVGTLPDESGEEVAYPVTITVPEPPPPMAAGSTATATITVSTAEDVLTVPTSAVGNGTVTLLADGRPVPTPVAVGAVGPVRTEVEEGLREGDQVVLADLDRPLPTGDQHAGPEDFTGAGPRIVHAPGVK